MVIQEGHHGPGSIDQIHDFELLIKILGCPNQQEMVNVDLLATKKGLDKQCRPSEAVTVCYSDQHFFKIQP